MALLGFEPAEPSEATLGMYERGKDVERRVVDRLAAKYGEENVERQRAVLWPTEGLPLGELHEDALVVPDRLAVEVKSTLHPDSVLDSAIVQLAGALRWDPDADAGVVLIASPLNNMLTDTVPVVLTDELRDRVDELADMVATAGRTGTLPPCSCATPGACRAQGCPFTADAWEGWVPAPRVEIDGHLAQLIRDVYEARRALDTVRAPVGEAEQAWKDACAALAEAGLEPGREYQAGPLVVKGVEYAGRETFSLARARKGGIWTPGDDDRFGPFVKVGEPHVRWTIDRVGDGPLPDLDFGEDAPF